MEGQPDGAVQLFVSREELTRSGVPGLDGWPGLSTGGHERDRVEAELPFCFIAMLQL